MFHSYLKVIKQRLSWKQTSEDTYQSQPSVIKMNEWQKTPVKWTLEVITAPEQELITILLLMEVMEEAELTVTSLREQLEDSWCCLAWWEVSAVWMWWGRWRSSWSLWLGAETDAAPHCSPSTRTPGEREPSPRSTRSCWTTCWVCLGRSQSSVVFLCDPPWQAAVRVGDQSCKLNR